MKIRRESPITGNVHELDINLTSNQLSDIICRPENIQKIAPNLTPDEREFLQTGIPPSEWKEFFANAVEPEN